MMKNILNIVISFLFIFITFSCNDNNVRQKDMDRHGNLQKEINESLEEVNRGLLQKEAELINDYIKCHDLNMVQTGTGLRYQIHDQGDGVLIKEGDVVTLEYEIRLLDGDLIYSSKNEGVKTFLVGRGGVESGLEEAILNLCEKSVATLIIPAHLAHGLIGDGDKIPSRATLVYKLKVIDKQ